MRRTPLLAAAIAFAVLIGLIAALIAGTLLHLQRIDERVNAMIDFANRKIDLVTQTQVAAHARTDAMFRMVLAQDAFERDDHFMAFNRAGFLVGSGRKGLMAMGLAADERRAFDAQTRLVNDIEALQGRIVDLLNAERSREALDLLAREAIPLQETFNQQLARMRDRYQAANLAAQGELRAGNQTAWRWTLAFGTLALASAFLIAWLSLREIRAKSRELEQKMRELEHSRQVLREEATHDPLTGLANRRLLYDRLQQAMRHAHRYGGKVGILFIDLDRFKEINDSHGHHVGDAVLTEVANRLTTCMRSSDSVARLGGDEFVVLLEGVEGRDDCLKAALKVEQALNQESDFFGLGVEIAASIGQALFPDDGDHEDTLIRVADAAMYRAKSGSASARQQRLAFGQ
jgi:diguanylate cyclase (GGDEF)-like protein